MILLTLIVLPSLFSIWKIPVHPLKLYSRVTLFVMPLLDLSRNKLLWKYQLCKEIFLMRKLKTA